MKVLKYFDKEMDLTNALKVLQRCKVEGIEILGLFIVGAPVEEEEDFAASVDFAVKANFDYVIVSELIVYPGTPLFEQLQTQINFSLFPYKNEWKDGMFSERNKRREKEFYRRFYYRKNYFALHAGKLLRHPFQYLDNFTKLASFIFTKPEKERADFI